MSQPDPDNPFQSPAAISPAAEAERPPASGALGVAIAKGAIRWFLVCGISAIPSWVIARDQTSAVVGGMVTGILLFAIGYTFLDVATRNHWLRQQRAMKWTMRITYGTRMAISLLYPVGFFVDLWCGLVAVSATSFLFRTITHHDIEPMHFASTLITTLVQGCLLNCVLAIYGLVVYAVCSAFFAGVKRSQAAMENRPDR